MFKPLKTPLRGGCNAAKEASHAGGHLKRPLIQTNHTVSVLARLLIPRQPSFKLEWNERMITNKHLFVDRPHNISGVQRIYKFKDGNGLSVVNCTMLHSYPFAWEIAVISNVRKTVFGEVVFDSIRYDTPLTEDVEVFSTDEEANEFIEKAAKYFGENN